MLSLVASVQSLQSRFWRSQNDVWSWSFAQCGYLTSV
jgi:hypothetical protein